MKLAVYSLLDNSGIEPYNLFYLASLKREFDEIIVVSNSDIAAEEQDLLQKTGISRYCHKPSLAFSLLQWEYVLNDLGYLAQNNIDEILFCTGNNYGPVYPFCELFSNDRIKECDAWGLLEKDKCPDNYASDFFVIKGKLLKKQVFREYWTSVRNSSIGDLKKGIVHVVEYLKENGFKTGYLINKRFNALCSNPELLLADELLHCGYPFVNKFIFRESVYKLLSDTNASQCEKAFDYIKSHTQYHLDLIIRDLLKHLQNSDLIERLHLSYVVPDNGIVQQNSSSKVTHTGAPGPHNQPKCALVIYSFFHDLLKRNLNIIEKIPEDFRIVIVTSSDDLFNKWKSLSVHAKNIEIRKQENRGRNESCYWVTCRDVIQDSDYICLLHDKKTNYWGGFPIKGYTYAYYAINSLVKSKSYIRNIVNIFEANPYIGLLMPFTPMFSGLDCVINNPWSSNREIAADLYRTLNLKVPFDNSPMAPWGGMFWVRGKAMSSLLRKNWEYCDFPCEPVPPNGTILHALERMYPMLVQDSGYLSAFICPASEYATIYFNTYAFLKLRDGQYKSINQAGLRQNVTVCDLQNSNSKPMSVTQRGNLWNRLMAGCRRLLIRHRLKNKKDLIDFYSVPKTIWDPAYYLDANQDVAKAGISPIEHYIKYGWKEGRRPSKSCATSDYLQLNVDCLQQGISPLEHYYVYSKERLVFLSYSEVKDYAAKHGVEILQKSSKFNLKYFLKNYKKKFGEIPLNFDPYSYYLQHGFSEEVPTDRRFNIHKYLDKYPDVRKYNICPVVHYELVGRYL